MSFAFIKFCETNSIPYISENHKHVRAGWIQITCPFCTGNPGYHLGYNTKEDYLNCWRCGFHSHIEVVKALANCSDSQARRFLKDFKGRPIEKKKKEKKSSELYSIPLPGGCGPLNKMQRKYLLKRNFNPEKLEKKWKIVGSSSIGEFKFRIIIPIYFKGFLVSYQGRDVTEKSPIKYKACKDADNARNIKECLYGLDNVPSSSVVVCEGVTDVWRLGPGAVATFGIDFKTAQVELLKKFKRVFVLFDDDPQAVRKAEDLAYQLDSLTKDVHVELIEIPEQDPADMKQKNADALMKDLMGEKI